MDESIKSMPDEEDAEFGGCTGGEDTERESVGKDEENEDSEEGEDGDTIDYGRGG